MSNRNFDILDAKLAVRDAKQAVGSWGKSLVRTDLLPTELLFLSRSFHAAKQRLSEARYWLRVV